MDSTLNETWLVQRGRTSKRAVNTIIDLSGLRRRFLKMKTTVNDWWPCIALSLISDVIFSASLFDVDVDVDITRSNLRLFDPQRLHRQNFAYVCFSSAGLERSLVFPNKERMDIRIHPLIRQAIKWCMTSGASVRHRAYSGVLLLRRFFSCLTLHTPGCPTAPVRQASSCSSRPSRRCSLSRYFSSLRTTSKQAARFSVIHADVATDATSSQTAAVEVNFIEHLRSYLSSSPR